MKKNLVLDIDNTLISTVPKTLVNAIEESGQIIPLHHITYDLIQEMVIYPRPHLQEFLDFVFENYNISIFTAAESNYAYYIIRTLILQDKSNRKLDFIMTYPHYQNCMYLYEKHKYMDYISSKNSSYTIQNTKILDDSLLVAMSNPDNIIKADPFEVIKINRDETFYLNVESFTDDYLLRLKTNLRDGL